MRYFTNATNTSIKSKNITFHLHKKERKISRYNSFFVCFPSLFIPLQSFSCLPSSCFILLWLVDLNFQTHASFLPPLSVSPHLNSMTHRMYDHLFPRHPPPPSSLPSFLHPKNYQMVRWQLKDRQRQQAGSPQRYISLALLHGVSLPLSEFIKASLCPPQHGKCRRNTANSTTSKHSPGSVWQKIHSEKPVLIWCLCTGALYHRFLKCLEWLVCALPRRTLASTVTVWIQAHVKFFFFL